MNKINRLNKINKKYSILLLLLVILVILVFIVIRSRFRFNSVNNTKLELEKEYFTNPPNITLAIHTVFLPFENTYFLEDWIKYHLHIGVDKIYLYDNENQPTYHKMLEKYGDKVFVKHYPGMAKKGGMQNIIIFHFTLNYAKFHNYIMHIDVDEFFCLRKHKSVKDLSKEFIKPDTAAIAFNWVFFGSNNLKEKDNRPVTERFTKCQKGVNKHIKLLVDTRKLKLYRTYNYINTNKKI